MTHRLPLLCFVLASLVGCPSTPVDDNPTPEAVEAPGSLAEGLSIRRIAINQAVEVTLVDHGELVMPEAPIVAGRIGPIRVYLDLEDDFEPRTLFGEITVVGADGVEATYVVKESVDGPSLREDLRTTVDFSLRPEELAPGMKLAIALRETSGSRDEGPDTSRWPADGEPTAIEVSDWGGTLRVAIIPVRVTADGSDRLPDTSPAQLEVLRTWLQRLYPVRTVELSVEPEFVTDIAFDSSSGPMSDLLEDISELRREREIPFDTYTYAMLQPAPTFEEPCSTGCTAGSAYRVRNPNRHWLRWGGGIGYSGDRSARTMVHEVGHQHDRGHAPCGNPAGIDESYPYPNASLGSWGYDSYEGVLVPPNEASDFMAYCDPIWVSDYQYSALWERLAQVEGLAGNHARDEATWLTISWRPGDRSRVRGLRDLDVPPDGDALPVEWLDADGATVGNATGRLQDHEDAPGNGTFFVEPSPEGAAALRVQGRTIPLLPKAVR